MKRASLLVEEIERIARVVEVYRNADKIIVGTPGSSRVIENDVLLTPAEIGNLILGILQSRIEAREAELRRLGIDPDE